MSVDVIPKSLIEIFQREKMLSDQINKDFDLDENLYKVYLLSAETIR